MNLFARNSPYDHVLKYLLFLLKHPVYILFIIKNTTAMFHLKTFISQPFPHVWTSPHSRQRYCLTSHYDSLMVFTSGGIEFSSRGYSAYLTASRPPHLRSVIAYTSSINEHRNSCAQYAAHPPPPPPPQKKEKTERVSDSMPNILCMYTVMYTKICT
jgi:hypothetical protein